MGPLGTQEQQGVLELRLDRGLLSSGRRGGARMLLAQAATSTTSTAALASAAAAFNLKRDVPAILTRDDKGYTWVENASYRRFREETGRGADFIIFPDVKPVAVNPPLRFSVPSVSK